MESPWSAISIFSPRRGKKQGWRQDRRAEGLRMSRGVGGGRYSVRIRSLTPLKTYEGWPLLRVTRRERTTMK